MDLYLKDALMQSGSEEHSLLPIVMQTVMMVVEGFKDIACRQRSGYCCLGRRGIKEAFLEELACKVGFSILC